WRGWRLNWPRRSATRFIARCIAWASHPFRPKASGRSSISGRGRSMISETACWPILTLFLGSLGLVVGYISRQLNRDARLAQDAALRDVSVQLCLLHEDLGL